MSANKYSAIGRLIKLQNTAEWGFKPLIGKNTIIREAAEELSALHARIETLEAALDKSDPWTKSDEEPLSAEYKCMHCGRVYDATKYNPKTPFVTDHAEDCIWLSVAKVPS